MARILEVLKQRDDRAASKAEPAPCLRAPVVAAEPAEAADEIEVPFIEIGPCRSMEASASVLATAPAAPTIGPRLVVPDNPPKVASAPVAEPIAEKPALKPSSQRDRLVPELIAYHHPEHAVSRQYRSLLTSLLAVAPAAAPRVLLFTSARPGCGATTVLLNVGITAARSPLRVVVVDANLRGPALADRLGLGQVSGLRDVLAGNITLDRALHETDQANLLALTAGTEPLRKGVRFVAETARSLARQLRKRCDLVLIDGPRWDGQPDVVALGAAADAVFLVLAEDEAELPQVDDLYQQIPAHGARLAGCILAGV